MTKPTPSLAVDLDTYNTMSTDLRNALARIEQLERENEQLRINHMRGFNKQWLKITHLQECSAELEREKAELVEALRAVWAAPYRSCQYVSDPRHCGECGACKYTTETSRKVFAVLAKQKGTSDE